MKRQRQAVYGIGVGFSLLIGVCVAAGGLAWRSSETTASILAALTVQRATDAAMDNILLAETAQRAYLLTHDNSFLPSYRLALKEFAAARSAFITSTLDNADIARETAAFARLGDEKFQEMDQTLVLAQAGRDAEALALVQSGIGTRKMAEARQMLTHINDTLDQAIESKAPRLALLAKILLITIAIAALCITILSVIVLRDTRRNLQFLEARETALRQLAATLEQRVARRTHALSQANLRFDAALRANRVTVWTQDTNLRFTWFSSPEAEYVPSDIMGRANGDVLPADALDPVMKLKQRVLDTGEPGHGEIRATVNGVEKWFEMNVQALRDEHGTITGLIGGSVNITERKEQEARIRLLMREVTHRSKNLLSVIQAIMRQTANHCDSIDDFQKRFADRLQSLAGSHDLLVAENWNGASLRELIHSQLGHYSDLVGSQIDLSGPAMHIRPDAAQHIGMALHELATNAAKYGALSVPDGRVRIAWTVANASEPEGMCTLSWQESDGPPVTPPSRRGFGRVVIERTVARAVGGEVRVLYPASGVEWELEFPRSVLV